MDKYNHEQEIEKKYQDKLERNSNIKFAGTYLSVILLIGSLVAGKVAKAFNPYKENIFRNYGYNTAMLEIMKEEREKHAPNLKEDYPALAEVDNRISELEEEIRKADEDPNFEKYKSWDYKSETYGTKGGTALFLLIYSLLNFFCMKHDSKAKEKRDEELKKIEDFTRNLPVDLN